MTINASAGILLLMYQIVAEERNLDCKMLRGTLQNDILKEFITRSTQIFPLENSIRFTADIFEYCSHELPQWSPISISGYHFAEAGATPVQEIAFTISNGLYYLSIAKDRGLDVETLASRVSFFFATGTKLLTEVAKLRAARTIWARLTQERYQFKNPKSSQMRIHAQTAGSELLPLGIENNLSRVTIQALAAIFGGVQSLHTNAHDEALNLPTEFSSGLAINIQEIIRVETDICQTPDPFGGSYYIEELTKEIENEVLGLLDRIERCGGVVDSIKNEFQRSLIEENAYLEAKSIEERKKLMVGINHGVISDDTLRYGNSDQTLKSPPNTQSLNGTIDRNPKLEEELIGCLTSNRNVMYPIKSLLLQNYSVSQICDILRNYWGVV
jgi:methylmalonyl-CoA mutase N-terminal domain/subunit